MEVQCLGHSELLFVTVCQFDWQHSWSDESV